MLTDVLNFIVTFQTSEVDSRNNIIKVILFLIIN